MAEAITIIVRCDDCKFNIGSLPLTVHGTRTTQTHGNNSNCRHPPIQDCPSAQEAYKKAWATARALDAH